jgi:chromosome segregation ATPase
MSDANKYVNYYIENALALVHENINQGLQMKTQLKVLQDTLSEKDGIITSLQNELSNHKTNEQEMNQAKANATTWESSYNEMKNKVSHMDTLTGQIAEAKKMLVDKNNEVNSLNQTIESLKTQLAEKDGQVKELKKLVPATVSKKSLNTKKKSTSVSEEVSTEEANTTVVEVEAKAKPPIVPYTPSVTEGKKVPWVPPGEKAEDMVALKVVHVVEPENETDDF